jgi:hypothetical protein
MVLLAKAKENVHRAAFPGRFWMAHSFSAWHPKRSALSPVSQYSFPQGLRDCPKHRIAGKAGFVMTFRNK